MHGASIGEVKSAKVVIERLTAAGIPVILTVNTATGRQVARGWQLPGLTVQLAPIDGRNALRRFLDHHAPRVLVNLEAEFWPMRFRACAARGIPILGLGTRISARSADATGPLARLRRAGLVQMTEIWPLDEMNRKALLNAGAQEAALKDCFNGKLLDAGTKATDMAPDAALAAWSAAPVILAASAHDGEQALLAGAFSAIARTRPDVRFIVAPRHLDNADSFVQALAGVGVPCVKRSTGQLPGPDTACYVADTISEMPKWYGRAEVTIICGGFTDLGGHSPTEAVAMGSFPVAGPDRANHADAFAALESTGAVASAVDAKSVADMALKAMDDPHRVARVMQGQSALAALAKVMHIRLETFCASVVSHLEHPD